MVKACVDGSEAFVHSLADFGQAFEQGVECGSGDVFAHVENDTPVTRCKQDCKKAAIFPDLSNGIFMQDFKRKAFCLILEIQFQAELNYAWVARASDSAEGR